MDIWIISSLNIFLISNTGMNIFGHKLLLLLDIYIKVEFLSHEIGMGLALVDTK